MSLSFVLAACGSDPEVVVQVVDGGTTVVYVDAGPPPAPPPPQPEAGPPPDAGPPPPVRIEAERELRGLWLATVYGLDFPGAPLAPAAAEARLSAIVDTAAEAGLNAIFFQVRPESDALYRSALEPWSRFLTGTQGQDPGYDPLGTLLRLAHARGIEVHAWMNPYRAKAKSNETVTAGHVASVLADHAITYGGGTTMDPSSDEVRQWVLAVVDDLLDHYAVDGLHFDDYFYPYPDADNTPFPDAAAYAAYQQAGGTLSKIGWRVDNVNQFVAAAGALVRSEHPAVRFGISPFGQYRDDPAHGIAGLDAYATLACDAPHWVAEGWVDYLAPQLYWPTTQAKSAFGTLAGFWAGQLTGDAQLFLGHALYQVGSSPAWSFDELVTQVAIGRGLRASGHPNVGGSMFYATRALEAGTIAEQLRTRLFPGPALPPALARQQVDLPAPVVAQVAAGMLTLQAEAPAPEFHALYTRSATGWTLVRVVGGAETALLLPAPGEYAVTSVQPGAVESFAALARY